MLVAPTVLLFVGQISLISITRVLYYLTGAAYIIITRLRTVLTLLLLTVFGHSVVLFRSMDITGLGRERNSVIFLRNLLPCRMR